MTLDYFDSIEWVEGDIELDPMTKRAIMAINTTINAEDFGLFTEEIMNFGINLKDIKRVDYDSRVPEFEEWLESDFNFEGYEGGYVVELRDGSVYYFCWYYGGREIYEVHPKQITIFEA